MCRRYDIARRGALIVYLATAFSRPVAAQEPGAPNAAAALGSRAERSTRRIQAARSGGEITLDGALDEASWDAASIARGFIQNDPREGEPATYDTEVRVIYDDDALYFGVFAKDDEPGRIIVNDLKKDYNTATSDGFRIILDSFHDERNGYQFAVNPAGAKWDSQMSNEGRENNVNWDGIWEVATRALARPAVALAKAGRRTLPMELRYR